MRNSLTEQVHAMLRNEIKPGDIVIDATAGNGHDTLLLAGLVGQPGCVFAFDNQQKAIDLSRSRLELAGLDACVTCFCRGHENMRKSIPAEFHGKIRAITFNLGYLPGGDKSHVTCPETTLIALEQGFTLLMPGGVLSVIAYTGHPGGRAEAEAVKQWAAALADARVELLIPTSMYNSPPEWLTIIRY